MRCRPSWANSNNPVPTVRFIKTSIATGAQDENRTHDLLAAVHFCYATNCDPYCDRFDKQGGPYRQCSTCVHGALVISC